MERIVFENSETGFLVGRLRPALPGAALETFVGKLLAVSPGEYVRLWGERVVDPRFGPQLRVDRYETVAPVSPDAIERYLGSGLIPGIGPKYAKRLVETFGTDTLRVIDEEPARLRRVSGIGQRLAARIREGWTKQKAVQSVMLFLQGHNIGVNQAIRIYKRYGDRAVAVLRDNPYRLSEDIVGISFRTADAIAERIGIAKDSPKRLEAGLLHALDQAALEGHTFCPREGLLATAAHLLDVEDASGLSLALEALEAREAVRRDGEAVYPRLLWQAEEGAATALLRLIATPGRDLTIHEENALIWVEKDRQITLSDEQRDAVRTALRSKVAVITGGPGTGKTTVLNSLLAILEKKGFSMELAAPTGRAAKRMELATGRPARTLHRLLEYSPKAGGFTRNESRPLVADLVVLDETSMLDIVLAHQLLRALSPETRLVLVGDVDQLPSVGPGNVLLDIIASGVVPAVWLKTVFRQAAESGIVANAHRINRGEAPAFNQKDFFLIDRPEPIRALETVVELVTQRIPTKFGIPPMAVQVLSPMHRGDTGVASLNEALQAALNPNGEPVPRQRFRLGDKVMQLRNNYELDVYNGDTGIVSAVDLEAGELKVDFEGRSVTYPFEEADNLTLAYASTIHKAQGSEYPVVVLALSTQHYPMLQRNVLYTAITRAREAAVLVGTSRALGIALGNTKVAQRATRLCDRLRGGGALRQE